MTPLRKVVFGFSFLPSIMFVLCFAIILPCKELSPPEACVKESWSLSFDDTSMVTGLKISGDGLLTGLINDGKGQVLGLDQVTGTKLWNHTFESQIPRYIDCNDYDVNDDGVYDCLLVDSNGDVYAVNASDGYIYWTVSSIKAALLRPVVLSDCDGDGIPEVAIVTHNSTVQVVSNGKILNSFQLQDCEGTPMNLFAWPQSNQANLMFVCLTKSGNSTARYLSQSSWCLKENFPSHEGASPAQELLNSFKDEVSLEDALFLTVSDGIVAWVKKLVVFFDNNAAEIWRIQNSNHSVQRFLIPVNISLGEHVALVSSGASEGYQITLLNILDGNETFSKNLYLPKTELKKAISISGKNEDYLLVMLETLHDIEMKAEISPNALPAYIVVPLGNETKSDTEYRITVMELPKVEQKIILLRFVGNSSTDMMLEKEIFSKKHSTIKKNKNNDIALAVHNKEEDKSSCLTIFLGTTVFEWTTPVPQVKPITTIKKLIAKDWDTSSSQCV